MVARGIPPNGICHRTNSARVSAPTIAGRRPRVDGTAASAMPTNPAWRNAETIQPGGVRSTIQIVEGNAQVNPARIPRPNRLCVDLPATDRSSTATPIKAAGHRPHGGTDAVTSSPATTGPRTKDLKRRPGIVTPSGRQPRLPPHRLSARRPVYRRRGGGPLLRLSRAHPVQVVRLHRPSGLGARDETERATGAIGLLALPLAEPPLRE